MDQELLSVCVGLSNVKVPKSPAPVARAVDWERIWGHHPSDAKDDALLARERAGPRWACILEKIEACFGSIRGLRTIELGSGRGDLSVLLAESGAEVTLLDSSEKALEQAQYRFDRLGLAAHYAQGDIATMLERRFGRFDVAVSSGVVEHFKGKDRTGVVRVHHAVLAPGGLAVISVPNAWCIPYRIWKSYLELRGWWPYGMEIPYTKRELIRRARCAGFQRVEGRCMALWQSIGDHWVRGRLGRGPDWSGRCSILDGMMGLVLLVFGWHGGD